MPPAQSPALAALAGMIARYEDGDVAQDSASMRLGPMLDAYESAVRELRAALA